MAESPQAKSEGRGAVTEIVAAPTVGDVQPVRGTIRVSPAVLIQLIELTVRDVAGVADLQSLRRHVRKKASEAAGGTARSYDDGKVRVGVDGDRIDADVAVSVERGTNVTALSHEIQRRIGIAAGQMLGMSVTTVNIYVEDIVGSEPSQQT
ncbi:MAG: Asp23/Gls24 family envelope stress response protein [Chloroflexota bacterium]|nr:Asp23/Gls24 family envelope stress response protein [Chloroflexota bacterium]